MIDKHGLVKRGKLTQATVEHFASKPFRWGGNDCARMAAHHVKRFGHKVPKPGGYRSALGAAKRLKELGCANIHELVDLAGLEAIAPAYAMMGDIVGFEADNQMGGIGIVVGNGNMLAFHEMALTPPIMTMGKIDKAWRV